MTGRAKAGPVTSPIGGRGAGNARHDLRRVLGVDRAADEHQHAARAGRLQRRLGLLRPG